jgi:hypothetical protein
VTLSRLSVLLILYVATDFANPLMPGAVTFLEGSVQAVHVERARFAECTPGTPVLPSRERIEGVGLTRPVPPPVPMPPVAWVWLMPARHALRVESGPLPPSEDH